MVGKLNYLTVTRSDTSFAVGVVSQFLNAPHVSHWNAVVHIFRYIKTALGKKAFCIRTMGTLILLGSLMLIGLVPLWIDVQHQDTVCSLGVILFLGKVRSKV